jgi:hypothetical protein
VALNTITQRKKPPLKNSPKARRLVLSTILKDFFTSFIVESKIYGIIDWETTSSSWLTGVSAK